VDSQTQSLETVLMRLELSKSTSRADLSGVLVVFWYHVDRMVDACNDLEQWV
jgi:hypothetical protein